MARLQFDLETVTPLITKGAANDPKGDPAELRAAPFRGMFRYWLRALLGTRVQVDIKRLSELETAVFGSAQRGSSVSMIVVPLTNTPDSERDQGVMPVHTSRGYDNTFHAFPPGSKFRLFVQSHPLGDIPVELLVTMVVAFRLGSLGRRARRGGGSLRVVKATYDPEVSDAEFSTAWFRETAKDQDELATLIAKRIETAHKVIQMKAPEGRAFRGLPDYPVLMPEYSHVLVGPAFGSARQAMDAMWNIRKQSAYHDDPAFGSVRPRTPSTVHMRVNFSEAGYHPVMTVFQTNIRNIRSWAAMQQFIDECESRHRFIRVFGEGRWT